MAKPTDSPAVQESAPVEHPTIEEHCAAASENSSPADKVNARALHAAAAAYNQWGLGKRMSRADYDAAISKVANLQFQ